MRKYFLTVIVLAASLMLATSGLALEKTAVRMDDMGRPDDWNAGTSACTVQYYNFCTGWIWIWSGWSPNDVLGTCFENCCAGGGAVGTSWVYAGSGAPSGYGYTGTIGLYDADANCCPGAALAETPFLPLSGWNGFAWGVSVTGDFVVAAAVGPASGNPASFGTDHPAAGPTGPQACGACYPTTRVARSAYYGSFATPLCPGSPFNDGVCDAELLMDVDMVCEPVSVEDSSFGKVKGLYR